MNTNEMLRVQDAILILHVTIIIMGQRRDRRRGPTGGEVRVRTYLSSGIDDLSRIILPIVFDDSAECVLNCGVVAFDEVVLHETDCEGGFAYTEPNNVSMSDQAIQHNTTQHNTPSHNTTPHLTAPRQWG